MHSMFSRGLGRVMLLLATDHAEDRLQRVPVPGGGFCLGGFRSRHQSRGFLSIDLCSAV